jgi:trk system potassium uptake protein TrkH
MTLLMIATRLDIITAFSAVVACINNTGPGLNLVGPATTYAVLTDFQTWVCTWAMLLGRLEIFTLLVILTPASGGANKQPGWQAPSLPRAFCLRSARA